MEDGEKGFGSERAGLVKMELQNWNEKCSSGYEEGVGEEGLTERGQTSKKKKKESLGQVGNH